MRYRPFGPTGKAVSAISLLLRETPNMTTPQAWRGLAYGAMENGINCLELTAGWDVMSLGLGEALKSVERRLIFLSWRVHGDARRPLTGEMIFQSVRNGLQKTGAGYFDLLMLEEGAYDTLTPDALGYLSDLRSGGLVLQVGIAGDGPSLNAAIASGSFDVLATPFSITSDWQARRRIREASDQNMTIIAYDPFPAALCRPQRPQAPRGLFQHSQVDALAGAGTYAFLHETPGWSAEELCLAHTLTEPAFATIQIDAARLEVVERLAAVGDRDLPTGVAAQIEMARFSADQGQQRRA